MKLANSLRFIGWRSTWPGLRIPRATSWCVASDEQPAFVKSAAKIKVVINTGKTAPHRAERSWSLGRQPSRSSSAGLPLKLQPFFVRRTADLVVEDFFGPGNNRSNTFAGHFALAKRLIVFHLAVDVCHDCHISIRRDGKTFRSVR